MHIEQCAHVHISSYWEGIFLLPLLPFALFVARSTATQRTVLPGSSMALHVKIHFEKIISDLKNQLLKKINIFFGYQQLWEDLLRK